MAITFARDDCSHNCSKFVTVILNFMNDISTNQPLFTTFADNCQLLWKTRVQVLEITSSKIRHQQVCIVKNSPIGFAAICEYSVDKTENA